jgi:hypothetical protein
MAGRRCDLGLQLIDSRGFRADLAESVNRRKVVASLPSGVRN